MPFFSHPQPFRLRQSLAFPPHGGLYTDPSVQLQQQQQWTATPWRVLTDAPALEESVSDDNLRLMITILEAVVEVICIALPGYIMARQGLFTAEMQKFLANLNVALFTPCLIFSKLAVQLSANKLTDLAIIPAIFVVNLFICLFCAFAVSKVLGFGRRQRNFVIAMSVFGNANSLPMALVISLSHTVPSLHWQKIPNDNNDEVAARGILYILVFHMFGQLLRWTWGYNVLLAPKETYEKTQEHINDRLENGQARNEQHRRLLDDCERDEEEEDQQAASLDEQDLSGSDLTRVNETDSTPRDQSSRFNSQDLRSGEQTSVTHNQGVLSASSDISGKIRKPQLPQIQPTPINGNVLPQDQHTEAGEESAPSGLRGLPTRCRVVVRRAGQRAKASISRVSDSVVRSLQLLPTPLQRFLSLIGRFLRGVWAFTNPPLWAMLLAILVGAVPELQRFFFTPGTFINNTVTSAIKQQAGCAIPLVLVVLGGNLAKNTLPPDDYDDPRDEKKLVIASLVTRLVLPFIFMAPLLAILAKFASVSILDDPIFVVVCFLVIGSPTALQLAQICQINNVYMGAVSQLLFQGYIVWILPSTLLMVTTALWVVQWAKG